MGDVLSRKQRNALIIASVVAASTAMPPTAALANGSQCTTPTNTCAGRVTFTSDTAVFTIFDQNADGHSAVVQYWLSDGSGPHVGWNSQGNGTRSTVDLNLDPGEWIFYRACLGEFGPKTLVADTCSAGVTDYAGGIS